MNREQFNKYLYNLCLRNGGVDTWARRQGISKTYVYSVVNGFSPPSKRILKPLGMEKVFSYKKIRK